jgi:hypothetical protein
MLRNSQSHDLVTIPTAKGKFLGFADALAIAIG